MLSKDNNTITHPRVTEINCKRHIQLRVVIILLTLVLLESLATGVSNAQTNNIGILTNTQSPELKVMTWNVRGGEVERDERSGKLKSVPCKLNSTGGYVDKIAKEIRRHSSLDVLTLQEIYRSQANELKQRLAGYLGENPSLYFVETKSCGRSDKNFGIAIISRYHFSDADTKSVSLCFDLKRFDFKNPFDKPFCHGEETRMLARVIIKTAEGRPVYIYNTHLEPNDSTQQAQVNLILQQVSEDRQRRPKDFAFRPVLMGDFNANPDSVAYRKVKQGQFLDAWREDHCKGNPCDEFGFTFSTLLPRARIDYIFIGSDSIFGIKDVQVTSNEDLFSEFNLTKEGLTPTGHHSGINRVPDHLPVVARLIYQ